MSESCSFCWLASLYKYQNQYTEIMAIHTPFQNNKYGWLNEIKLYGKFLIRTSSNHLEEEDEIKLYENSGSGPLQSIWKKRMDTELRFWVALN